MKAVWILAGWLCRKTFLEEKTWPVPPFIIQLASVLQGLKTKLLSCQRHEPTARLHLLFCPESERFVDTLDMRESFGGSYPSQVYVGHRTDLVLTLET